MNDIRPLLDRLWQDFATLNPRVRCIYDLLVDRGEQVVNDHIALRTFGDPKVGLSVMARPFLNAGFRKGGDYDFPEKKLTAQHFEHEDAHLPKVFISELRLDAFSPWLRETIRGLLSQVPDALPRKDDFAVSGRPWKIDFATYEKLAGESEYAGWVGAFGFRANHFTVLVNALKTFKSLQELNAFIKASGYELNASGGEIKGDPAALLEQSSTLADHVGVHFTDGPHVIPACYYEFARRYPDRDGKLFSGFVAKSANKIFESTDRRGKS